MLFICLFALNILFDEDTHFLYYIFIGEDSLLQLIYSVGKGHLLGSCSSSPVFFFFFYFQSSLSLGYFNLSYSDFLFLKYFIHLLPLFVSIFIDLFKILQDLFFSPQFSWQWWNFFKYSCVLEKIDGEVKICSSLPVILANLDSEFSGNTC